MTFDDRAAPRASTWLSAVLAIAVSAFWLAEPAAAANQLKPKNPERCRNYASKAVEHNASNKELKCGYRGNHWSDSRKHHAGWCTSVGAHVDSLREQHQEREIMLDKCRSGGKKTRKTEKEGPRKTVDDEKITKRCRAYADKAVKQTAAAKRNKCGFNGDRWNDSKQYHAGWCRSVGARAGQLKAQSKERAQMIANCKTRK